MFSRTSGAEGAGHHVSVRTTCGREIRIGHLALGGGTHPAQRVSLGISASTDTGDGAWAGLTADEAAQRICRAVVERPRRVAPALGLMGQLFADAAPAPFDGLLRLTYRWSRDSSAARGEDTDELEAPAFAQGLLRRLERLGARRER